MFTVQNILDIAIRLESNGEKIYREARKHTDDAKLKALLSWIAEEECSHARWFDDLKERILQDEDHHIVSEMSRALVEDVIQGQAFSLQEVDFKAIDTPEKMIRAFIGFEDDTVTFYKFLQTFVHDSVTAAQLEQIVAEEEKHIRQLKDLLPG
ncbi:MAG: ferritin family protein [Desulfosarcina sp.]